MQTPDYSEFSFSLGSHQPSGRALCEYLKGEDCVAKWNFSIEEVSWNFPKPWTSTGIEKLFSFINKKVPYPDAVFNNYIPILFSRVINYFWGAQGRNYLSN